MRTSESIATIAPALLAAQKAIGGTTKDKTGKIETKTGRNYEYKYSDLASVLDEIKGPLNENGIMLLQSPTADASGVTVTTRFLHQSGEWIEESLYMPVPQSTPQAYGSAITYCRRYAAQSMTGCKAEDDDGKAASTPATKPNTATQVAVDALEGMDPEEQDFLRSHAAKVNELFRSGGDMAAYLTEQKFDTEERLAMWALLTSDVRAKIKKQQATSQSLAEQA